MKLRLSCATWLALLSLPLAAQEAEREDLQVTGERALRAVEKHLGVELQRKLVFREASPEEIERILRVELLPQFENQFDDAEEAKKQSEAFASSMAPGLLAKYEFGTGNVLIASETITQLAKVMDEPGLDAPETLQAILVHECVHVLADQQYAFAKRVNQLQSTDAILAYNAVIEGHAQHVARQVCAEEGWTKAFELFTASIGKVPDLGDEGLNMLARATAVSMSWAYYDGEQFIAAIEAADKEKGIERAYLEPPAEPALIFRPEWYLDPSKRPEIEYDLGSAFDRFQKRYDDAQWMKGRQSLNEAQLRQALSLLDDEAVSRVVKNVERSEVAQAQTKQPPGEKLVAAALFVCNSAAEASFLLACEERLMRLKDEQMTTGAIQIKEARYEQQRLGAIQGLHAFKIVQFRGRELPVTAVVLTLGRVVVELTFSNEEISVAESVSRGAELLKDAVLGGEREVEEDLPPPPPPVKPAGGKGK